MYIFRLYSFLLFFCAFAFTAEAQQPQFYATTNAKQITLGTSFSISYTVKNGKASAINPPAFKNFELINDQPSTSMSTSISNGKTTQQSTYSYGLKPKRIGKFTIPAASAVINGKNYKCNPVKIEVVKGNSNAVTQAQIAKEFGKKVFVKLVPNTTEARVGQQITLDYKLYTTINIEQYNLTSEADYDGFYRVEMRKYENKLVKEEVDGVQYTTKILRRLSLYPQRSGTFNIDPALIKIGIAKEGADNSRRTFFFRKAVNWHNVATNKLAINVLPLPPNAPESFTGAVGHYTISAALERKSFTTDDAVALRISIQGDGDLKQVQNPPLSLDENLEVYDPKVLGEKTFESRGVITGKKDLEYLILAKKPGRYTIRPQFTYFDPDSLRYMTLASRPYQVTVTQGKNKGKDIPIHTKPLNEEISPIAMTTTFHQGRFSFWGTPLFWILWVLPFLALGAASVYRQVLINRGNIDLTELKRSRAEKVAQKRLATAEQHLKGQKSKAFYDEVSRAMLGYICDKLNIPTSELTKDNVREKLQALNVKDSDIERFMAIIKNCEIALFAGMDNSAAMQTTYDDTISVVAAIEEGWNTES